MLDTATKKRIDDCRDILVGKLPDPKAQIEQITIGLIYKFMDDMDKEAIELGGTAKFFSGDYEKYSWAALFDTKVTASEMLQLYSEAIVSMDKNPKIPQLFRNIFKNAYLPYRDPETLKMFLKTIGEFEYTHSEKLGDAFEYLLSIMGSQGDAGQFRTPRHIIDFLVAVVDPDINDTILDPACGTAGFLISAFKYIREKNKNKLTPDERKRLIQNVVGYDISPDMVRLSLVNLYLHGFSDPHISEYDTLSSEDRWNDNFDVILANPPFMSPKGGIRPHKKFSISSNRSEVLFVDYIAEHLNSKGRAGIIVPEGIIFQSGTAYKDLRKMLVDKYLYAVVSLPAGVFNPYSGVKTSILLMDKELAKTNNNILFVKIDNDGYGLGAQRNAVKGGQLEDAIEELKKFRNGTFTESEIAHMVSKTEISKKGDCNLSGERYKSQTIIKSNYELVQLKEIAEVIAGQSPRGEFYNEDGIGLAFYQGKTDFGEMFIGAPTKWTTEITKEALKNDILMSVRAPVGPVNYATQQCCIGRGLAAIRVRKLVLNDFLFYLLKSLEKNIKGNGGAVFDSISKSQIEEIKIPLPPLSVQEEIVAEIEGYQKIIDGAKMVVENYKPRIDIDPEWEMVELGYICDIKSGGTPSRVIDSYWNGNIPWVGSTVCKDTYVNSAEEFITDEGLKNSSAKLFDEGTTLIALVGATIGKTGFLTFKSTTNQNIAGLIPKDENHLDKKFLYFACQTIYNNFMSLGEGKFRMATLSFIREQKIALPEIKTQHQIVSRIEKEQVLVNANKQLIDIFEQKIKDRIARVWGEDKDSSMVELPLAAEPVVDYSNQ